jgi:hypothetical protein
LRVSNRVTPRSIILLGFSLPTRFSIRCVLISSLSSPAWQAHPTHESLRPLHAPVAPWGTRCQRSFLLISLLTSCPAQRSCSRSCSIFHASRMHALVFRPDLKLVLFFIALPVRLTCCCLFTAPGSRFRLLSPPVQLQCTGLFFSSWILPLPSCFSFFHWTGSFRRCRLVYAWVFTT